jgi:hypothetical protein
MNRVAQVHWLARGSLAFVFAYHGLVPKLIAISPGELALLQAHGLEGSPWISRAAGVAELALAAVLLLMPGLSWPLLLTAVILFGLLLDVAVAQPSMLMDAFNPVTLNVAGIALCTIAWMTRNRDLPARVS